MNPVKPTDNTTNIISYAALKSLAESTSICADVGILSVNVDSFL